MKEDLLPLFKNHEPVNLASHFHHRACVAIILKGDSWETLEVAFIQRAFDPSDRWSGHIAFPGGRHEETDPNDFSTAVRETKEEVGIDLHEEELLGRLDDVQARKSGSLLDFYIRPFVFHTKRDFGITLDASEVADFFWMPLKEIQNPLRQTTFEVPREHGVLNLPAVYLDREPPLWGLTYMMILNLLQQLSKFNKLD